MGLWKLCFTCGTSRSSPGVWAAAFVGSYAGATIGARRIAYCCSLYINSTLRNQPIENCMGIIMCYIEIALGKMK